MSLTIQQVSLRGFRSYDSFLLEDIGALTVLVGPNATGKTNLMESLRLVTSQKTLRHASSEHLLGKGRVNASVSAEIGDGHRQLSLSVCIEEGKRKYSLNGKVKRTSDLKGVVPSVAFVPDDLNLAKGSMSLRRQTLDSVGEQVSANHYLIRKDYEKVVRHKNHLLKDGFCDKGMLDAVNQMLVMVGSQLSCYRMALLQRMMGYISDYYSQISGGSETLTGSYTPSWMFSPCPGLEVVPSCSKEEARAGMEHALDVLIDEERVRRKALVGPHADTVDFFIDGMRLSDYGSQGQQRSFVLAWKLAEVSLIRDMLNQQPVLLLDDVMSELDACRREQLLSFISDDIQTFISTAHLDYFNREMLSTAKVVTLEKKDGLTYLKSVE